MRSFVVHFFFVFQDIMWLVKSSWCVLWCSIHHISWVSDRCRSEFALWWFFVRKSCHSTGSFFFLVLTNRHSLSFHKFERQRFLFGVDNALFTCYWYLGVLSFWFQFFSVESCHFMCLSVMRFFSLQVFPFLITVSSWYYHFDVLIFILLFKSTGVAVVALANLRWCVFVSTKLSQIGSFHKLLVLATECFFSFDIFEIHSDAFWGC